MNDRPITLGSAIALGHLLVGAALTLSCVSGGEVDGRLGSAAAIARSTVGERLADRIASREYWASRSEQGLQAPNRKQNLRTFFRPDGIQVVDRTAAASPMLVELSLARIGRGESLEAVPAGELHAEGNRVELWRPGLTEWYVNDEAGIEQGFTLARPPGGASSVERSQWLVFELKTRGAKARRLADGVVLTSETGQRLSYAKLAVVDAKGRALASRFEIPRSDVIRIQVDDWDAAYPIVIDPLLSGTFDSLIESNQASAQLGFSVASAGDVNGDGYDDVIVGAPLFDAGHADEGAAFILLGSATGIDQVNPLEAHAQIESNQINAQMGYSVASAGDVNGDGYADVIIGSPLFGAGQGDEGVAWVYLGSATGIADGNPMTAHAGFESNQTNAQMGFSVASAGDVNGDDYDDVIVGSPFYDNGFADEGMAFVYHGSASGFTFGNPTTANARLESDQLDARFGVSVASAGDVDEDGYSDVIVGAYTYDSGELDEGSAFVFHGGSGGIANNGSPATAQARLESDQAGAAFGLSVASAGDVDGDGFDDVIVGAFAYDFSFVDIGSAFFFVGSATGIVGTDPDTVNAHLVGGQAGEHFGRSVASAGDLNSDGFDDLVVGSLLWSNDQAEEGRISVYYGDALGPIAGSASPDLTFESNQVQARLGISVASAGDVNGDGSDDLVAGAFLEENGSEVDEGVALYFQSNAPGIVASVFGFEGSSQLDGSPLSFGNLFYVPPDTMGAVGLTQFVEFNNKNVSVYDKLSGTLLSRIDPQTFWQQAGIPSAGGFHTLGDQRVLFDPETQRWIASSIGSTYDLTNLAVSATSDPLGTWRGIQFAGVAPGGFADFPTLALDRAGVYVGTTNYASNQSFIGPALSVIPKLDLFAAPPTLARKTTFSSIPGVVGAIQGAVHWNSSGNRGQIVADNLSGSGLRHFVVDGADAAGATISTPTLVDGAVGFSNDPARQPDGTRLVNTYLVDRPSANAVQIGDRIFVTRTVTRLFSAPRYTVVNWQVIDATSGALIEEGDIGGGGFDYYQGSIAVNAFGEAVIGYNRSGSQTADGDGDGRPDGRITFMAQAFVSDGGGGLDAAGIPLVLRVSDVDDYRCGLHSTVTPGCFNAWGDTSAVTIDPTDPRTFYAIGEYAAPWAIYPTIGERAVWHTYVARIRLVPEPELEAALMVGVGLMGWLGSRRSRGWIRRGFRASTPREWSRTRPSGRSARPARRRDVRGRTGSVRRRPDNHPAGSERS